jgi:hypothetical protein
MAGSSATVSARQYLTRSLSAVVRQSTARKHKPRPDHPSGANRERPVRSTARRRPHAGQDTRSKTLCNGKDLVALFAGKRYDAFVLRTGRESDRRCSGVRGSFRQEVPSHAAGLLCLPPTVTLRYTMPRRLVRQRQRPRRLFVGGVAVSGVAVGTASSTAMRAPTRPSHHATARALRSGVSTPSSGILAPSQRARWQSFAHGSVCSCCPSMRAGRGVTAARARAPSPRAYAARRCRRPPNRAEPGTLAPPRACAARRCRRRRSRRGRSPSR